MKYLIFLDIDGTVLMNGVHPRTIRGMQSALDAGHIVMLNTGRALGNIPRSLIDQLPLSGLVAGLGNYIQYGDEVLVSNAIGDEDISFAMHIADTFDHTMVCEGETHNIDYHGTWYAGAGNQMESIEDMHQKFPGFRVTKIGYRNPLCPEAVALLSERFSVWNHPDYAEMGTKGNSKATAMEYLQNYFGVDRSHVIAMGDSINDIEMLQAVGTGVAMGNAADRLKEIADDICGHVSEEGIYHYCLQHGLI